MIKYSKFPKPDDREVQSIFLVINNKSGDTIEVSRFTSIKELQEYIDKSLTDTDVPF